MIQNRPKVTKNGLFPTTSWQPGWITCQFFGVWWTPNCAGVYDFMLHIWLLQGWNARKIISTNRIFLEKRSVSKRRSMALTLYPNPPGLQGTLHTSSHQLVLFYQSGCWCLIYYADYQEFNIYGKLIFTLYRPPVCS